MIIVVFKPAPLVGRVAQHEGKFLPIRLGYLLNFTVYRLEIAEPVERRGLYGKLGQPPLHFKQRKIQSLKRTMERVKMKRDDSAARAKVRHLVPRLRARETGQQYRIGGKAVQPRVLNNFQPVDEHIFRHFIFR